MKLKHPVAAIGLYEVVIVIKLSVLCLCTHSRSGKKIDSGSLHSSARFLVTKPVVVN